eukprot:11200981-Lingulodinium_polyedra.AAC.1
MKPSPRRLQCGLACFAPWTRLSLAVAGGLYHAAGTPARPLGAPGWPVGQDGGRADVCGPSRPEP